LTTVPPASPYIVSRSPQPEARSAPAIVLEASPAAVAHDAILARVATTTEVYVQATPRVEGRTVYARFMGVQLTPSPVLLHIGQGVWQLRTRAGKVIRHAVPRVIGLPKGACGLKLGRARFPRGPGLAHIEIVVLGPPRRCTPDQTLDLTLLARALPAGPRLVPALYATGRRGEFVFQCRVKASTRGLDIQLASEAGIVLAEARLRR
jgi:hypothetical protein